MMRLSEIFDSRQESLKSKLMQMKDASRESIDVMCEDFLVSLINEHLLCEENQSKMEKDILVPITEMMNQMTYSCFPDGYVKINTIPRLVRILCTGVVAGVTVGIYAISDVLYDMAFCLSLIVSIGSGLLTGVLLDFLLYKYEERKSALSYRQIEETVERVRRATEQIDKLIMTHRAQVRFFISDKEDMLRQNVFERKYKGILESFQDLLGEAYVTLDSKSSEFYIRTITRVLIGMGFEIITYDGTNNGDFKILRPKKDDGESYVMFTPSIRKKDSQEMAVYGLLLCKEA